MSNNITVQDVKRNRSFVTALMCDLERPNGKAVFTVRIAKVVREALGDMGFPVQIGYTYEGGNTKAYLRKSH